MQGMNSSHLMDQAPNTTMRDVMSSWLPDPLVSVSFDDDALLSADFSSLAGGEAAAEDRISALPDHILRDIVSRRLPVKDAARTALLSSRWLLLWRSTPLVLVDSLLVPPGAGHSGSGTPARDPDSSVVTAAVSQVLEAHPGPFRCVDLTSSSMVAYHNQLVRWFYILAIKRVEELILVNRPWPLDATLPIAIFSLPFIRRLHLGVWRFPDTAKLPRGVAFPNLQELRLGCMTMEDKDLEFILARSPALETLVFCKNQRQLNLRIISRSLWSVQLCMCLVQYVAVVNAPRLERLLLWETICSFSDRRVRTRVKIGHAPNLRLVGFLEPGVHVLEVGDTVIKIGTKASANTIIPSVKVLALKVRFGVRNEAKMLPSFLRCFPNIETVHIESRKADERSVSSSGRRTLSLKFWQENARTECVQSHIKEVVFHQYRGKRSELTFIKFILENAEALQELVIVFVNGSFSSDDETIAKLTNNLSSVQWANQNCNLVFLESSNSEQSSSWSCQVASNSCVIDPFEFCY